MTDAVEQTFLDVIRHLLALSDDAYLSKHPEWQELVHESQQALCRYDQA